jgi:hypothetical protein
MTCTNGLIVFVFLAALAALVERRAIRGCCSTMLSSWSRGDHERKG